MNSEIIKLIAFIVFICLDISILIFSIVRKAKVVSQDTILEQLVLKLPDIINQAEKLFKTGGSKKSFVLGCCYSFLSQYTGKDVLEISKLYEDKLSVLVEDILSTPQKKKEIL